MGRRHLTAQEALDALRMDREIEFLIGHELQSGCVLFMYASAKGTMLRIHSHLLETMPDHNDVYEFQSLEPDNPWHETGFTSPEELLAYTSRQSWSGSSWVNQGLIQEEWADYSSVHFGSQA